MHLKRQTIEFHANFPSDGLILVNKPSGIRTTYLLNRVKALLHLKKAGHAGTLDPFAEGLVLILYGKATKLMDFLGDEKEYIGTIKLGVVTDTDDPDGKVILEREVPNFTVEEIEKVISKFKGNFKQVVPLYSAVKKDGERLYNKARKGEKIESLPEREVWVEKLELINFSSPFIEFRCLAKRGTYMRALARDIGEALGCGAHLYKLVRLRVGPFVIDDAYTLSDIESGNFEVVKFSKALPHLETITLREESVWDFIHGNKVRGFYPKGIYQVKDVRGNLLGIGKGEIYAVQPVRVFSN